MRRTYFIITTIAISSFIFGWYANPAMNGGIQGGHIGPTDTIYIPIQKTNKCKQETPPMLCHYWYWCKSITFPGHGGTFEGYGLLLKGDTVVDSKGEILVVASEGKLLKN